jgi:plastocyanin
MKIAATAARVVVRLTGSFQLVTGALFWTGNALTLLPAFGMTQSGVLPGDAHRVIQVLHLLVGPGAVGLAETLARRIRAAGTDLRAAAALAALLALVTAACGPAGPAGPAGPQASAGGARQITVIASEMTFNPATVEVRVGEPARVTLTNRGVVEHNWQVRLGGEGVSIDAGPRQSASTTLIVPAAGTYDVVCSLPGHAEAGMRGTLVAR